MNSKTQMEKVIAGIYHNTAGMIVRKNGDTVYEKYYNGYTEDNTVHVASVTKSIVSGLFGIALEQGYLKSVDQKVLEFFPEYETAHSEKAIQRITIRDMLTMTAPYKCKTEPYAKIFSGDQWVNGALDLLGGKDPIGEFRYSPLVGVHILSGVLTKATGQSVLEFARKNLFSSLDIVVKDSISFCNKEEQLAFLKASDLSVWAIDPEGINTAGWGLTLTTRDMAKIGQLYLDMGKWNGRQFIPEQWVRESTSAHSRCRQWKLSYGYLWWVIDAQEHIYAAMGDGGNIIYVNTRKHIVVAITCSYMPQAKDRLQLIRKYIEPAFDI